MAKNKIKFEKDEKKSIIIALVVSAVLVLSIVLGFIALKKYNANAADRQVSVSTETTEVEYSESGQIVVINQDELNNALENTDNTAILFQTEEEESIVIPSGDYSTVALTIDAPYSEVTNYGVFSEITINRIASNTWIESVSGNSLLIDSPACHVVVPEGITVNSIRNIYASSTLAVEVQGTVDTFSLEADASIASIQIDGMVNHIYVYAQTNLSLTGSQTMPTEVSFEYGSDNSTVNCKLPVNMSSYAGLTAVFEENALGSRLSLLNESVETDVTNNTTGDITVADTKGQEVSLASEENRVFTASQSAENSQDSSQVAVSNNSTGTSQSTTASSGGSSTRSTSSGGRAAGSTSSGGSSAGSSSSGGATSGSTASGGSSQGGSISGDSSQGAGASDKKYTEEELQDIINSTLLLKPMIVSFVEETEIYAGIEHSGLLNESSLGLPDEVYGVTATGETYKCKVASWNNADGYTENAGAGTYRFYATLSDTGGCNVATGVRAEADVYVGAKGQDYLLSYEDRQYENQISVEEYRVAGYSKTKQCDTEAYYYITNNSQTKVLYVALDFYYFDKNGQKADQDTKQWFGRYLQPGQSWIAEREAPGMEYAEYVVRIKTSESIREPATNYAVTEVKYDEAGQISLSIYKKPGTMNVSECAGMFLYIGLDASGNKVVYGKDTFKTFDGDEGINATTPEKPLVYTFRLPAGADFGQSRIVMTGSH